MLALWIAKLNEESKKIWASRSKFLHPSFRGDMIQRVEEVI